MRYFLQISICLLLSSLFSACSTKSYIPRSQGIPLFQSDSPTSTKYNLSFIFRGKQTLGILATKKMSDGEIRILATTLFGLSLFDFGLRGDSMHVYNCIEPLKKKNTLKLLESDFQLLFTDDDRIKKLEQKENCLKFSTGTFFSKTVISASPIDSLDKVEIRHPWIRLTLNLDRINNEGIE